MKPQTDREGHLQYLLTAYLFGDISADGKREVEAHLAACAVCRAELEELRSTAGLLQEAVAPAEGGETEYSFEAHRIERVLAASGKGTPRFSLRRKLFFAAAAAAVLVVSGLILTPTFMSSRGRRSPTSEFASVAVLSDESAAARRLEKKTETGVYRRYAVPATPPPPAGEPHAASRPLAANVELFAGLPLETAPAATPPPAPAAGLPGGAGGAGGAFGGVAAPGRAQSAGTTFYHDTNTAPPPPATLAMKAPALAAAPAGPAAGTTVRKLASELARLPDRLPDSPPPLAEKEVILGRGLERSAGGERRESKQELKQVAAAKSRGRGGVTAGRKPAPTQALQEQLAESKLNLMDGTRSEGLAVAPVAAGKDSYSFGIITPAEGDKTKALQLAKQVSDEAARAESESRRARFFEEGGAAGNKVVDARKAAESGVTVLPFDAADQPAEEVLDVIVIEKARIPKPESNESLDRLGALVQQSQDKGAQVAERLMDFEDSKALTDLFAKKTYADGAEKPREDDLLDLEGGYRGQIDSKATELAYESESITAGSITDGQAAIERTKRLERFREFPPEVIAAHGFQDRDDASYTQLQTLQSASGAESPQGWSLSLGDYGLRSGSPAESPLRGWSYFRRSDPQLTWERYKARPMPVPPPSLDGEGLSPEDFRRRFAVNGFVDTRRDHFSTFGMDVDTASYSLARNALRAGKLPEPKTVRVEEFINSFPSEEPADPERVFSVFCDGGPSPFGVGYDLLLVTVKARTLREREEKPAVLTFAVDTSGSMNLQNRLDLVRASLSTLVGTLKPEDRVGIVAYNAHAYLVLPHTAAREQSRILGAVGALAPGGASNVEAGLDLAYRVADEVFEPRAVNRVILCSDGVANAGARGPEEILQKVKVYSGRGIYLSTVGFGATRYNDALMETLADRGNGNYSFVDGPAQANEVFKKNLPGTLQVLAQDAKIQVDFDPAVVSHYRLLGYENRDIADKDFRNDKIDAGEVGPGATVSVLYEIRRHPRTPGDLGRIHLRYRDTGTGRVDEQYYPLPPGVLATSVRGSSERFRFVAAVAELAELLRGSYWARDGAYQNVLALLRTLGPAYRARPEVREVFELAQRAQILTMRGLAIGNVLSER